MKISRFQRRISTGDRPSAKRSNSCVSVVRPNLVWLSWDFAAVDWLTSEYPEIFNNVDSANGTKESEREDVVGCRMTHFLRTTSQPFPIHHTQGATKPLTYDQPPRQSDGGK